MSWILAVEIPTILAEYLIASAFFKDFLGRKNHNKLLLAICIVAFYAVPKLSDLYVHDFAVKASISALLLFSLTFLFDGNIKIKLLSALLFLAFLFVADAIVYFFIVLIWKGDSNTILNKGIFAVIGLIASKLLVLLISKIVGSLRKKDNTRLSFQYWLAVITFPVISIFILFVLFDLNQKLNSTDATTSLVSAFAVVGILYFNILAFRLFEFFAEKSERDLKERILKSQVAAQIRECERLNYESIAKRSFLHDLRHHNQLLYNLVEKGNANEALNLISKMLELNNRKGEYVLTGNSAINALFNSHLGYAESMGIRIDVEDIHLPAGVELDIEDICIIFANSLENAIESCQNIPKTERYIKIGLKYRNDRLVYKITNPTDGNVIKNRKGGFKSTKNTTGEHGIGIENIEKAVNKYGGVFSAEHNDNVFTLGFSISFLKQ